MYYMDIKNPYGNKTYWMKMAFESVSCDVSWKRIEGQKGQPWKTYPSFNGMKQWKSIVNSPWKVG